MAPHVANLEDHQRVMVQIASTWEFISLNGKQTVEDLNEQFDQGKLEIAQENRGCGAYY
jgi:hypothetical protein